MSNSFSFIKKGIKTGRPLILERCFKLLPFLKRKDSTGIAGTVYRKSDEDSEPKDESYQGLKEAMQDLISAFSSGDATKASEAFKAANLICQSDPDYQNEQMEEDTE